MTPSADPDLLILDVVWFIMITHIIMSWLINFQVLNLRQPIVYAGVGRAEPPAGADLWADPAQSCRRPAGSTWRRWWR